MTMEEVRKLVVLSDELLDAHQLESDGPPEDPLDLVWRAYALLEEAGSAIFRLSGGWTDRACNRTFGVRRSPIEMAIGEFDLFKDDPALLYMDIHTSQFYVIYSRTDEEWTHWQISPEGAWEKVDREAIWDATSWWLWNGKLHRAIRSILMGGSSEGISIEETADGNLRLSIILDESYVHMWDWTGRDSLDLTLVLDPETFALAGYTWEVHGNPDAAFGQCLTYREAATDGRLGVDIVVPEEIYSTLAGSN